MRAILGLALVLVLGLIAAFALGILDLNASGGKLPQVTAEAGRLPSVEVKTGKVEVGTKKEVIEVPTVGVKRADER